MSSTNIIFQHYKNGFASVRLINDTEKAFVQYVQNGTGDIQKLAPGDTVLYTWDDPVGRRELLWTCGQEKNIKTDLLKDAIDEFFYNADTKVYWVSFLDGMQRVLLFTEDIVIATVAQQAGELEQVDQEINISLHGFGLSLVNNHTKREVAYMGITNSGVIWEEKRKRKWKSLKVKHCTAVEAAYQQFLMEREALPTSKSRKVIDGGKLEVDFDTSDGLLVMTKPHRAQIRRNFEDGVWIQYRTSPHQIQCHIKIHRLQLDNQLPGAVFQTVLAPVPPPKSVAAESIPKPFTELSILLRKRENSNVMQYKYAKILVQEMAVKVDQGFLNSLIELFSSGEMSNEEELALFKADCDKMKKTLADQMEQISSDEQKHFFDILHFSPLKIHLSFSLYGTDKDGDQPTKLKSDAINLFLQSVGIVLTDIQDVIFKLGYFERKFSFYSKSQLKSELTSHYSQQAIKQMYVLVLGLDVLGNPFGVIRGLAEGIEDLFYEPYQGAIQGPEEFAEGLALGVRSLLGHAVGGAAGAVSRITGALGKGIATLTLDDAYQKKRREQLNKRPADLKEGLARGGKGLVMGVFDGVTGIVRKPVEGAKEEGVKGFFKGAGKGLVGVFTRPASGVVDFASSSFEGIKRVTELSDEVRRLRPPRYLQDDGIVRTYRHIEAEGNDILQELEKGKYARTDGYIIHMVVTKDLKNILLVTDKRVAFVTKGEILGHWDCEWQYQWDELKEPPSYTNKGIQILLKEKQRKSFFGTGSVGKLVPVEDKKTGLYIAQKIQETMVRKK